MSPLGFFDIFSIEYWTSTILAFVAILFGLACIIWLPERRLAYIVGGVAIGIGALLLLGYIAI